MGVPPITLEKKSVLITGAGKGMGQAYAVACAQYGADVAGFDQGELDETASLVKKQTGKEMLTITGDMLNLGSVEAAVSETINRFGKLDVLVNNAGILVVSSLVNTTEADFDRVVGVNLKGVFFACKYAARHMITRRQGVIINIGSQLSFVGAAEYSAYASTKGGVFILSQSLAIELGKYNIRVVTLSPGPTKTPMHTTRVKDAKVWDELANLGVLGRMNEPEDLASTLVLLASDAARMVTGTNWSVDGGCLAK